MNIPYLLSLITYLPAAGALLLWLLPSTQERFIRWFSFLLSLLVFLLSLALIAGFDPASHTMQFEERLGWISFSGMGIFHHLGVDGLSLFLVLLTTFLSPIAILSSFTAVQEKTRSYYALLLLLETGMIGVFLAIDMVLFYVFWEVMLIPMYLLIGIWGGHNRVYAAVKFILYTMAGSLLMLVGIIYLHNIAGSGGFNLIAITNQLRAGQPVLSTTQEQWLFLAFFLAFAIKVPLFPFHTWLPDAHVEAPTAGSVLLAGVLLKMGAYGMLRFCLPMFPHAAVTFAPYISALAVIGIIYGALVSMVQPDLKKLVAYSSVSHLGFVVLGIFAFNMQGIEGASYQMLNHGLSTGALFLLVGMIYERRHTRLIEDFGGLAHQMPIYAMVFMIITLSSIGLPGLNGFVGEFLILLGTFAAGKTLFTALAVTGVIFSAVYMLWMYQRVFLGELNRDENRRLPDLNGRELACLLPIIIMIVWMGLYSSTFLRRMDASVAHLIQQGSGAPAPAKPKMKMLIPMITTGELTSPSPGTGSGEKRK
jgi:NADH-quinone oxidoreductase subunit M